VLAIGQGRAISAINLGLCVINLEAGGRMRHEGARLTEVEVQSRQALSVAFVALQVVGLHRQYRRCCYCHGCSRNGGVSLLISVYMSWYLRFSSRVPASGSPLRAGAEGVWPRVSLIGVAGCLGWISDCARFKGLGEDAV
jgi:hypothetical protein